VCIADAFTIISPIPAPYGLAHRPSCRSWQNLPPGRSKGIKARSSPSSFQHTSLSLPSYTAIVSQPRRALTFAAEPVFPVGGYETTSEKYFTTTACSYSLAPIRLLLRQHCLIDRHGRGFALDNDTDDVLGFPGSRATFGQVTALDAVQLSSFNSCERIHITPLRLHRRRQYPRQHVDWLPH
jgi:hypothetical protein